MKYIKLFEKFDNKFEQDIRDMFVELEDKGYKIIFLQHPHLPKLSSTQITIYKFLGFDLEYVKDYILMFVEYMKERFNDVDFSYKLETIYQEEIPLSSFEDIEDFSNGKYINKLVGVGPTELVSIKILID